jgi:hypothetical protein
VFGKLGKKWCIFMLHYFSNNNNNNKIMGGNVVKLVVMAARIIMMKGREGSLFITYRGNLAPCLSFQDKMCKRI